jgi:hypothetical protein
MERHGHVPLLGRQEVPPDEKRRRWPSCVLPDSDAPGWTGQNKAEADHEKKKIKTMGEAALIQLCIVVMLLILFVLNFFFVRAVGQKVQQQGDDERRRLAAQQDSEE